MFNLPFINVNNLYNKYKHNYILINNINLLYISLHYRLSTFFYLNQLVDIFSYEIIDNVKNTENKNDVNISSIVVYNFHSILSQNRNFILTKNFEKINNINNNISSISDHFSSANWLERETSELSNINFIGRKDLRNLMLQYGDTSSPLLKSFPSVGFKETYYSSNLDMVIQKDVSMNL